MKKLAILILIFASTGIASGSRADEVGTPLPVATTALDGGTMGIPRWKGYMDQSNPDHFWISYGNAGTSYGNVNYTTDGGQTWSNDVFQVDFYGYLDYHTSVYGRSGELYYTWPGRDNVRFRKFSAPAQTDADRGPLIDFSYTTAQYRSNIMVQDNGRIWVFTRYSNDAGENVRYNYSDDNGANWTSGMVNGINFDRIRIGSMPYINGNPALVVVYLNNQRGFEYFLWNGTQFEQKADGTIYAGNIQNDRAFTHNVIAGQYMHLVFSFNNDLHHCWKAYNNGTGSWNHEIIESSPNTDGMEWYPISSVRGNDMYIFYCVKQTADESSSTIYYRKWSQDSQTWTDAELVSTGLTNLRNVQPNTCPTVPESSDYIPVYWQSGLSSHYNVYFNKISVNSTPVTDTIPPAPILDLWSEPN